MAQAERDFITRRSPVAASIPDAAARHPDSPRDALARNVRTLRAAHRLSQHALADDAGLTPAVVSAIETRKGNPTMVSLERIARALGVDMAALFADRAKT
jgi:DNA-binding XRE family transcriptional regulator